VILPDVVSRMFADADAEERALEAQRDGAFDIFISSDYPAVWSALTSLQSSGGLFLEWGSGLGVVAAMGAMLGLDAHGIELQPALVARARAFAKRQGVEVTFAVGTIFPDDLPIDPALFDEDLIHGGEGADGYVELGTPLEEFDVIYGFPWPGEEELFLELFRRGAGAHATLLLNLGRDGIRVVTR